MSTRSWLAFRPRDTVFVRDGRSFDAASDPLAQTVRPSPDDNRRCSRWGIHGEP